MFFGFARCLGHWNWWFLHRVIGSLSVANHFYYFLFTNLDADDFGGLYLFAGPRAILECYEGRTIEPLQIPCYVLDVAYEGFLLKPLDKILKDRNPFFPYGHSFRHSILDRIIGENDPCKLASLGLVMDAYVMISLGQHCGSSTAQLDLYNKTSKLPLQLHRSRLSSLFQIGISQKDFWSSIFICISKETYGRTEQRVSAAVFRPSTSLQSWERWSIIIKILIGQKKGGHAIYVSPRSSRICSLRGGWRERRKVGRHLSLRRNPMAYY